MLFAVHAFLRLRKSDDNYIFDHETNGLSLNDKRQTNLSGITRIEVNQDRSVYHLDVRYTNNGKVRLGSYGHGGIATEIAQEIAEYVGVPVKQGTSFF